MREIVEGGEEDLYVKRVSSMGSLMKWKVSTLAKRGQRDQGERDEDAPKLRSRLLVLRASL